MVDRTDHQRGHGWRTVKTTRTGKGGAYSARYRLNSATGRFKFWMRLRPNDTYPYARGTSRAWRCALARRALLAAVLGACVLAPATARAGTYDVYSCKVGSAFYANNAWLGINSAGAGDPTSTAPDTTCANSSDPLIAIMRPAAAGATVAYGAGASSALRLNAPTDTRITDFTLTLRHWFSTPSNVGFNLLQFGTKGVSLAGSWDSSPPGDQAAMSAEGHWYGNGAAIDSGFVTLSKSNSAQARSQGTGTSISLYAGCSVAGTCTFDQNSIDQLQLLGSRVTIEDTARRI